MTLLVTSVRIFLLGVAVLVLIATGQNALNQNWLGVVEGLVNMALFVFAECVLAPREPEE